MGYRKEAREVVERLFVDGATRLVLEQPGTSLDGPGWCKRAVEEKIATAIRAARRMAKLQMRRQAQDIVDRLESFALSQAIRALPIE